MKLLLLTFVLLVLAPISYAHEDPIAEWIIDDRLANLEILFMQMEMKMDQPEPPEGDSVENIIHNNLHELCFTDTDHVSEIIKEHLCPIFHDIKDKMMRDEMLRNQY